MNTAKTESPNSPWLIFRYAEGFHKAAENFIDAKKDPVFRLPRVVMDSFSAELYLLKCLHVLELGKTARGHDLKKLFGNLPLGTQASIRTMYQQELQKNQKLVSRLRREHKGFDIGLDNVLELSSEVFERIRYLFEGSHPRMFYWPLLSNAIRTTILAINPNWKE